jgi:CHASE2 domain-containing sensor protein
LTNTSVLQGNGKFSFWIGTLVGLVGVFGLGQFYLGYKRRGLTFLATTAALAVYVAISSLLLRQVWGTPWSPTVVFGILWLVQTYDLYNLAKVVR